MNKETTKAIEIAVHMCAELICGDVNLESMIKLNKQLKDINAKITGEQYLNKVLNKSIKQCKVKIKGLQAEAEMN